MEAVEDGEAVELGEDDEPPTRLDTRLPKKPPVDEAVALLEAGAADDVVGASTNDSAMVDDESTAAAELDARAARMDEAISRRFRLDDDGSVAGSDDDASNVEVGAAVAE